MTGNRADDSVIGTLEVTVDGILHFNAYCC